jgi:hypothetical protein
MSDPKGFRDELEPFESYKQFNSLSIVALVIAPFTLLGFFHIGFVVIGGVAVALAFLAVRKGQSAEYKNSGLVTGYAALFIACILVGAIFSYERARINRIHNIASGYAEDYIRLIQNQDLQKAYEMQLAFGDRPSVPESDRPVKVDFGQSFIDLGPSPEEFIEKMHRAHPFGELIKDAGQGTIEYLGPQKIVKQQLDYLYYERFQFTPADKNMETYVFDVVLNRDWIDDNHKYQWRILSFDIIQGTKNQQTDAIRR